MLPGNEFLMKRVLKRNERKWNIKRGREMLRLKHRWWHPNWWNVWKARVCDAIKIINTYLPRNSYVVSRVSFSVCEWERDVLNLIKKIHNNPHSCMMRMIAPELVVPVPSLPFALTLILNNEQAHSLTHAARCHQYHCIVYRQRCHSFSISLRSDEILYYSAPFTVAFCVNMHFLRTFICR